MNDALEIALHAHRASRDWGNEILAIGILIEIAIDAFWPEHVSTLVMLRGPKATRPLKQWRLPLFTLKGFCILLAGLVVLYGLIKERNEGNKADDVADQIRTNLQERLIQVSPRSWLIQSTEVRNGLIAKFRSYAGQKVVFCVNQKHREDKFEAMAFAMSLDSLLDKSGWLGPSGGPIVGKNGVFTNIWIDVPECDGVNAVLITAGPKASAAIKKAAKTLSASLLAEHVIAVYPDTQVFGSPPLSDPSIIIVVVSRRPLP